MRILLYIILVFQRLGELRLAKRNEEKMIQLGGFEVEGSHYKGIKGLHILFFLLIIKDGTFVGKKPPFLKLMFFLFLLLQFGRYWCIHTLGERWNTKIIILPNSELIKKGPYRWINHPNYWIVGLEFFVISFIFQAFSLSILFPILHFLIMKYIRIPAEERALTIL
ncbi:isoprenylcysteine carboxylmethyltransferase family protein [Bacillaceae bacterium S4-13-56]